MNRSSKTIAGVVTHLDSLLDGLELGNRADRTEDLLAHNLHIRPHIGKDSRLDKVSLIAVALAASNDLRTIGLAALDVSHDAIELQLANLRALEGLRVEGVADLVLLGALLKGLEELIVDTFLHEDARAGAAALSVVEVDAKVDPADGLLDVGVVKHDVGRLATQLESHLL